MFPRGSPQVLMTSYLLQKYRPLGPISEISKFMDITFIPATQLPAGFGGQVKTPVTSAGCTGYKEAETILLHNYCYSSGKVGETRAPTGPRAITHSAITK